MPEEAKVHIGNLCYRCREDDLRNHFEKYGPVEYVNIIKDRDTGRAKGYAFVTFEEVEDAKAAIDALHHTDFMDREITVEKARSPRSGGGGGGGRRYGDRSYGGGGGGRNYNQDRRSYGRDGGYRDRGGYNDRYSGGGGYRDQGRSRYDY